MSNRVTYNVQDVLIGPESSVPEGIVNTGDFYILKRLDGVQSFNYSFSQNAEDISILGRSDNVDKNLSSPIDVNLDFEYYINNINNEHRLGFYTQNQQQSTRLNFISNFTDQTKDYRNFYLVSNYSGEDIKKPVDTHPDFDGDYPTNVADPNSSDYTLLSFLRCYTTSYSSRISVGEIPTASISLVGDGSVFYITGNNNQAPFLDPKTLNINTSGKELVIPKKIKPTSSEYENSYYDFFKQGDIGLTITRTPEETNLIKFETNEVQSVDVSIDLGRENISYLGYKANVNRDLTLPTKAEVNVEVLDNKSLSGNLQDLKSGDYDYNFSIDFTKSNNLQMNYLASGAKLESINYSNSIGSNRTISLGFSVDLDLDDNNKGFFVSGLLSSITGVLINDDGDTLVNQEGNTLVGSMYPQY